MIVLTKDAEGKVAELLALEDPDMFLRVGVSQGGCSGLAYEIFFDSKEGPDDVEAKFGDVRVVADKASAELLAGASLDYGRDGANGFAITNPSNSSCGGCSESTC